jgi:hypothetical protein
VRASHRCDYGWDEGWADCRGGGLLPTNVEQPRFAFEKCRPAFEKPYLSWVKAPMPGNWRAVMYLDGFAVPHRGDESNDWEVCYFVEPAGHYFAAVFRNESVDHVAVDG